MRPDCREEFLAFQPRIKELPSYRAGFRNGRFTRTFTFPAAPLTLTSVHDLSTGDDWANACRGTAKGPPTRASSVSGHWSYCSAEHVYPAKGRACQVGMTPLEKRSGTPGIGSELRAGFSHIVLPIRILSRRLTALRGGKMFAAFGAGGQTTGVFGCGARQRIRRIPMSADVAARWPDLFVGLDAELLAWSPLTSPIRVAIRRNHTVRM